MASADKSPSTGPRAPSSRRRFDQGLFAYHRGDYSIALKDFEKACEQSSRGKNYVQFVECCTYVLRILAEREEFGKIERIEARVLEILASAELPVKLKSRVMYILGICSCYQDTRHELAMRRFREAIDFAILGEDKEALAAPLYGAATVLYARHRYEDALKELERLSVLLSCLHLPDLVSAANLLKAMVRRNQGKLDDALEAGWVAFESLKHHPNLVLYLHTLCVLGTVYRLKGDVASARIYLDLADRTLKREEFPRIARLVDEAMSSLGVVRLSEVDLAFDTRTGILIEKKKGEIRFEGQFILRDLLRLFVEHPGAIFTKEDLVKRVWRESSDPKIHDNKIYVTIKRLRKLLESGDSKSDYILRAKNGYFLNPKTRILINDQPIQPATQTDISRSAAASSGMELTQ